MNAIFSVVLAVVLYNAAEAQTFRKIQGPPGGSFTQVLLSHDTPGRIYAIRDFVSDDRHEIVVTSNYGVSWQTSYVLSSWYRYPSLLLGRDTVNGTEVEYVDLYFAEHDSSWRSIDGGQTWVASPIVDSSGKKLRLFKMIVHSNQSAHRLLMDLNGDWRLSTDHGASWRLIPDPPAIGKIAWAPSDPAVLYQFEYGNNNMYVSRDTAQTWSLISSDNAPSSVEALVVDHADPQHLVAIASSLVLSSTSGGITWDTVQPTQCDRLSQHPQQANKWILWGSEAHCFQGSDDGASSFMPMTPSPPPITSIDAWNDVLVTGGMHDQIRLNREDTDEWSVITGNIRSFYIYEPSSDSRRLHSVTNDLWYLAGTYEIARTTDAGWTWSMIVPMTADDEDRPLGIYAIGASKRKPDVVYVSTGDRILRSDDQGATWIALTGLPPNMKWGALTVDPTNSDHVIVGSTVIYRTTDGGSSWSEIVIPEKSPMQWAYRMKISPITPEAWIILDFGPAGFGSGHVTTDAGITWNSSSPGTTNQRSECFVDRYSSKTFYITSAGVNGEIDKTSITTDAGDTWMSATVPPHNFPPSTFLLPARDPNTMRWAISSKSGIFRQHLNGTWHRQHDDTTMYITCVDMLPNNSIVLYSYDEMYLFEPDLLVSVEEQESRRTFEHPNCRMVYSNDGTIKLRAVESTFVTVHDPLGRLVAGGLVEGEQAIWVGAPGVYAVTIHARHL